MNAPRIQQTTVPGVYLFVQLELFRHPVLNALLTVINALLVDIKDTQKRRKEEKLKHKQSLVVRYLQRALLRRRFNLSSRSTTNIRKVLSYGDVDWRISPSARATQWSAKNRMIEHQHIFRAVVKPYKRPRGASSRLSTPFGAQGLLPTLFLWSSFLDTRARTSRNTRYTWSGGVGRGSLWYSKPLQCVVSLRSPDRNQSPVDA